MQRFWSRVVTVFVIIVILLGYNSVLSQFFDTEAKGSTGIKEVVSQALEKAVE